MTEAKRTARIVFMGTPDFAVPVLATLQESGGEGTWQVAAVATQPDRRRSRKKLTPSPVKQYAQQAGCRCCSRGFRKDPRRRAIGRLCARPLGRGGLWPHPAGDGVADPDVRQH